MGKAQREKGARLERHLASVFKEFGWPNAKRNLSQYQDTSGRDLDNTFPFVVQCKGGKRPNPIAAYREADAAREGTEIPLACIKHDGNEWLAVVELKTLLYMWRKVEGLCSQRP